MVKPKKPRRSSSIWIWFNDDIFYNLIAGTQAISTYIFHLFQAISFGIHIGDLRIPTQAMWKTIGRTKLSWSLAAVGGWVGENRENQNLKGIWIWGVHVYLLKYTPSSVLENINQ